MRIPRKPRIENIPKIFILRSAIKYFSIKSYRKKEVESASLGPVPNNIQFIFPLCISKLSGKKKGLTAWENVDSLDFFKTSLFWSKKILSIQNIQKQSLLDYLPKTQKWKKVQFFDKNNGLISSENFYSWTFLKLHFQFWSKKRCF